MYKNFLIVIGVFLAALGIAWMTQNDSVPVAVENRQSAVVEPKAKSEVTQNEDGTSIYNDSEYCYNIKYKMPYAFYENYDHDLFNYDINDPQFQDGRRDGKGVKLQVQKHEFVDGRNLEKMFIQSKADEFETKLTKSNLGNIAYTNKIIKGPGGEFDVFYASTIDQKGYYTILVWNIEFDKTNIETMLKSFTPTSCL